MPKTYYGKCALCGKECTLTFEHIPPKSAFNSVPARPVSGTDIITEKTTNGEYRMPWDTTGLKYQNQQEGMGRYSLCETCNNNTGSWYGSAYTFFANVVNTAISYHNNQDANVIIFKEIYPLRFIKQVFSLFCSIDPTLPSLDPIRKFVLDRNATGIDKTKFKLCLYFTKSKFMKQTGYMLSVKAGVSGPEMMALSEITAYPFGFILYFNPTETWSYKGIDITTCAEYGYNEKINIEFPWILEEMNDVFPECFRSKEEIERIFENYSEPDFLT